MRTRSFTIRVPASSANIGPGFDVVGVALSLYLTVSVFYPLDPPAPPLPYVPPKLTYSGEGKDEVPLDPYKNLTTRVALYVLRCHALGPRFPSHLLLHVDNDIPFGRGLGSSGAAVIAGVLLANELGHLHLPLERLLDFALMVERHPDNVTAALVGGLVGAYLKELDDEAREAASVPLSEVIPEYPPDADDQWGLDPPVPPLGIGHFVKLRWSESIKAVAIIPQFELSTAKARDILPLHYSRKDLVRFFLSFFGILILWDSPLWQVFNLQRLAVLTTALGQTPPDPELIYEAMKDRIHQPYRKSLASQSLITPLIHQLNCFPDSRTSRSHHTNHSCNTPRSARYLPFGRWTNNPRPCHKRFRGDRRRRSKNLPDFWDLNKLETLVRCGG